MNERNGIIELMIIRRPRCDDKLPLYGGDECIGMGRQL